MPLQTTWRTFILSELSQTKNTRISRIYESKIFKKSNSLKQNNDVFQGMGEMERCWSMSTNFQL